MKHLILFNLILLQSIFVFSQTQTDSLLKIKDLHFDSEFEKQAFVNFKTQNEFNLCLATDKSMTEEKSLSNNNTFNYILKVLGNQKLTPNNIRQKFKRIHGILYYKSPMLYNESAEFSDILTNGYFNFLTASTLYSLALNELKIPSYFIYTPNKTDIIINPEGNQTIIESINQKDENGYFNISENKSSIVNLLDKNIRIGSEYKYNSNGGGTVVRFKETDLIKKNQLAATIYFNKAIWKLNANNNNIDEPFGLLKKACYLYPNEQFVNTLYYLLSAKLEKCKFNKIEDVDLLALLSRFSIDNFDNIKNSFHQLLGNFSEKQNDLILCTEAYNRLLPEIKNAMLVDEISFSYHLYYAYHKTNLEKNITPLLNAFKIKPNDKKVNEMLQSHLYNLMYRSENRKEVLDTIVKYEKDFARSTMSSEINKLKLLLYLDVAKDCFSKNELRPGVKYINLFESGYNSSLLNPDFRVKIENTYYEFAMYFIRMKDKKMAQKIVDRGMEYIPNSSVIKSVTETIPTFKPTIVKRKMNKEQYDEYMKKKVIEIYN